RGLCAWCRRGFGFPTAARSKDFSSNSCAESTATEFSRLDQTDEERVELVVLVVAAHAEPRHRVLAESPIHAVALAQNADPLRREVFGLDSGEPRSGEQFAVARSALDVHGGHPLMEPEALTLVEAGRGDPVGEGDAAVGAEHSRTFG